MQTRGVVAGMKEDGSAYVFVQGEEPDCSCPSDEHKCHCADEGRALKVRAINTVGASVGDIVHLDFKPWAVAKSLGLLMVIPVIGMLSGIMGGMVLSQQPGFGTPYLYILISGGLLGGLALSVILYRRISKDLKPSISRIIRKGIPAVLNTARIDPVCKRQIDHIESSARIDYRGEAYYFCRPGCLEAFVENPDKYIYERSVPS